MPSGDAGRRTSIQYSGGTRVTSSYDNVGNQLTMADSTGVTTYTYVAVNRPATVTYPAGKTFTYTYDNAGNRATLTAPDGLLTTYTYGTRRPPRQQSGRRLLGVRWRSRKQRRTRALVKGA
jgi:YD repeat-containing protein